MQGNPSNSHFSMSAFATVERRRREELLAIQKQDRDRQQAQTTAEPVVPSPPEQQDSPPHPFIELALSPAQGELPSPPERTRISDSAGQATATHAALLKESRMPLINPLSNVTDLDRRSEGSVVEGPAASLLSPPTLDDPALYGLAGRIIRSLAPHSEADPVALLLQFLAAFGNLAGPAPHSLVGSTRHGLNLFVVLVGESSKARKGTSWRQIATLFAEVDQLWNTRRVATNRPTAVTILQALQDQPSPTDRRLFLLSEEFASILPLLARETGQLSPLLRCAWDGGDLSVQHGTHLIHATAPHISLVGHVTQGELLRYIGRTETHSGFANRCLWTSVHRSQSLPNGGAVPPQELSALASDLRRALDWIHTQSNLVFRRSPAAQELWNDCYPRLSHGRPDVYGAATSRAEAQVLRLSALYAALDCSPVVELCHLHAALAVWDYCRSSARLFFDTTPIDPTASRITQALDVNPQGLSQTQIRGIFHHHISKERIELALEQLTSLGLIYNETARGRGRSSIVWAKVPKSADAPPY
jgi:hypothetical protein